MNSREEYFIIGLVLGIVMTLLQWAAISVLKKMNSGPRQDREKQLERENRLLLDSALRLLESLAKYHRPGRARWD